MERRSPKSAPLSRLQNSIGKITFSMKRFQGEWRADKNEDGPMFDKEEVEDPAFYQGVTISKDTYNPSYIKDLGRVDILMDPSRNPLITDYDQRFFQEIDPQDKVAFRDHTGEQFLQFPARRARGQPENERPEPLRE